MEARPLLPGEDISQLVDSYIQELDGLGGDIPHTTESVRAIVLAVSRGMCMVYGSPAVAWTAAMECPMPWPTTHGRTALSLGTYVDPAYRRNGIAKFLRVSLQAALAEQGFDTLLGGVHVDNAPGRESLVEEVGFTPYQVLGYRRLA